MLRINVIHALLLFRVVGIISSLAHFPLTRILSNTVQFDIGLNQTNTLKEVDFTSESIPVPQCMVSIKGWVSSTSTSYKITPTTALSSSSAIALTLNNYIPQVIVKLGGRVGIE